MSGSPDIVAHRPLSLHEWATLDTDIRGELVDGQLVEEELPSYAHEIVVAWLLAVLGNWARQVGGFALPSETKLRIRADRGRKPDLVMFFGDRPLPARRASIAEAAPDVVVEVVTPTPRDGRRDRLEKRSDYAEAGVPWYWIVDPELRSVEILRLSRGRYADALLATTGTHPVPGCGGLELDLDALWAELDRWPEGDLG